MIFRGIMLSVFARAFGPAAGVVTVSLLFALLHWHVPSMVPLFIIGLGFSLAYMYTSSIVVPFVMHAAFNGVSLGMLMLMRYM